METEKKISDFKTPVPFEIYIENESVQTLMKTILMNHPL